MSTSYPNDPASSNPADSRPEVLQVLTSVASGEDAQRLAVELVQRRLAACVQIESPIRSVYRWENEVQEEREYRLTAKTTRSRFADLCTCLEEMHPYDVPEIIATAVVGGGTSYLRWVAEQVCDES